jgi:hypothetical protein
MKKLLKLYILIVITVLFVMAVRHCHAQTNANVPPAQNQVSDSTAQDIAKVFSDFGIDIPVGQIGGWLFVIYFAAKIARNKTPLGNGAIGSILSSVVNAEQKTLPPKP